MDTLLPETAYTVAAKIAAMLRANGVAGPTPTPAMPCSLEYLIENALRNLGRGLRRGRLVVERCDGELFPKFVYPER